MAAPGHHTDPIDAALPAGRWAVGISGGADSVALLLLACDRRPTVEPHVVHLDHRTRGADSTADAAFVADLARRLGVPATVDQLNDEARGNPSARYRRARLDLFRRVVAEHHLAGVMLAHHAADQAETVAVRLLRGGGPRSLVGMAGRTTIGGVAVARPLLRVDPADLRRYLIARGQPWREDASNAGDEYLRNRVGRVIRPGWRLQPPTVAAEPVTPVGHLRTASLVDVADAARGLVGWLEAAAPALADRFAVADLHGVAAPVAAHAAGRWLAARGCPADSVNRATCDRLVAMATDAATAARQTFPGAVRVSRRGGWLAVG